MKIGRNDLCLCGSGRKYKRCCLDRDQASEREQRISPAEPNHLLGQQAQETIWAALESSVAAVTTKDRASLLKGLDDFAALLRTDPVLADLRFDEAAFGEALGRSLRGLGRSRGARARRRLFQLAMKQLGDHDTLQKLADRLARSIESATLGPPERQAIAAALVCLAPVVGRVPLPPGESPTVEIIFNVQLEQWLTRGQTAAVDETLKHLLASA